MFLKIIFVSLVFQNFLINSNSVLLFKRQADICNLVFCENGGTCFQSNNLAMCKCVNGFYGMWCQFRRLQVTSPTTTSLQLLCSYVKCQNGGICFSNNINTIICICPEGFYGQFCQTSSTSTTTTLRTTTNGILKGIASYNEPCNLNSLCDQSKGLVCPSTASNCNCPINITIGRCDCPQTKYWNGISCTNRKNFNQTCQNDYECSSEFDLECRKKAPYTCQCKDGYFRSLSQNKCLVCPNNMTIYDQNDIFYPYKCYIDTKITRNFTEAKNYCENSFQNASLMRIENQIELSIAILFIDIHNVYWLDSFITSANQTYKWGNGDTDVTSGGAMYCSGGGVGFFDTLGEDSLEFRKTLGNYTFCMNDRPGKVISPFFCQYGF